LIDLFRLRPDDDMNQPFNKELAESTSIHIQIQCNKFHRFKMLFAVSFAAVEHKTRSL